MAELAFAGYHSFSRIGRGGLGDVFRAVQSSTGTPVAVKVLRDVSDTSTAWHRTRRELTALQALRGHPNVIESIELVERAEGPALVMEYAAGGSLGDLMQAREAAGTRFSVAETLFVARQTATALLAAHERGIVHRDIKPQNLLIDGHGQIKLCDFGIAALTHDERYRTRTNAVSMRYASPEDLESDQPVGPPSDVYSLGATLLHLAHGAPPTLRDRLSPWVPPGDGGSPDGAALDRIIAACLHPSAPMRPTAAQLVAELDELAAIVEPGIDGLALPNTDAPIIRFDDGPASASDATTVLRARRPVRPEAPVMVERPKIRPHSPRTVVVVGAVAAATIIALATGVWVTGVWSTSPGSGQGIVTADRPAGLTPLVATDWTAGAVGDCLVQTPDDSALAVVDCAQPHDLQRFTSGELADGEALTAVDDRCSEAFEQFVGAPTATSAVSIAQTRPSRESWITGDRSYHCYLGVPDRRLVGTARASGW